MAYYIVYFNHHGSVIDVSKYCENEYVEYLAAVQRAKDADMNIQHGYF